MTYPRRVTVFVGALTVAAAACVPWFVHRWEGVPDGRWPHVAVLVVMAVLITSLPVALSKSERTGADVQEVVFVAAFLVLNPVAAALSTAVGWFATHVVHALKADTDGAGLGFIPRDITKATFNVALYVVVGAVSLAAADLGERAGLTPVAQAVLAAAVLSVSSMMLVAVVTWLLTGAGWRHNTIEIGYQAVVLSAALLGGYTVGAAADSGFGQFAAACAVVVGCVYWWHQATEKAWVVERLERVLDTVTKTGGGMSAVAVRDNALAALRDLVPDGAGARMSPDEPADDEVAVKVDGEYLAVTVRSLDRATRHRAEMAIGPLAVHVAALIENAALREELMRQASEDVLTGIANRREFDRRAEEYAAAAVRRGRVMAVAFFDLDGFKPVNDTLGHDVGDDLLRQVAGRMAEVARREETVARLGGDEFALLMPEVDDAEEAMLAAARVADAVDVPFDLGDGQVVTLGVSVGVAVLPGDGSTVGEVVRVADQRMYLTKQRRKAARQTL